MISSFIKHLQPLINDEKKLKYVKKYSCVKQKFRSGFLLSRFMSHYTHLFRLVLHFYLPWQRQKLCRVSLVKFYDWWKDECTSSGTHTVNVIWRKAKRREEFSASPLLPGWGYTRKRNVKLYACRYTGTRKSKLFPNTMDMNTEHQIRKRKVLSSWNLRHENLINREIICF